MNEEIVLCSYNSHNCCLGVNYYSVFKKKQLQKELDEFEKTLKDLDDLLTQGVPRTL